MQLGLNLGFSPPRRLSGSGGTGLQGVKFWTFNRNVAGLIVNLFTIFTNGLRIDWGDGTSATPTTSSTATRTLERSSGITFYSTGLVTHINTQSNTSPVLGGDVDVSNLPNLIQLSLNSCGVSSIRGYETNNNLQILRFTNNTNSTTLTLPTSFTSMTSLQVFECYSSNFSGAFPNLTGLTNLISVRAQNNSFSGSMPSLQGLTVLSDFLVNNNQFTGSMPNLAGLVLLQNFWCSQNNLTGAISALTGMNGLQTFQCDRNQFSGSIPSLSGRGDLTTFLCFENQLTTLGGSAVPVSLGNFQAQNNLLTTTGVNKILNLFVLANKTTGTRILNLGGTGNAAPTGQGLTDKATLISRGWTVTTN